MKRDIETDHITCTILRQKKACFPINHNAVYVSFCLCFAQLIDGAD